MSFGLSLGRAITPTCLVVTFLNHSPLKWRPLVCNTATHLTQSWLSVMHSDKCLLPYTLQLEKAPQPTILWIQIVDTLGQEEILTIDPLRIYAEQNFLLLTRVLPKYLRLLNQAADDMMRRRPQQRLIGWKISVFQTYLGTAQSFIVAKIQRVSMSNVSPSFKQTPLNSSSFLWSRFLYDRKQESGKQKWFSSSTNLVSPLVPVWLNHEITKHEWNVQCFSKEKSLFEFLIILLPWVFRVFLFFVFLISWKTEALFSRNWPLEKPNSEVDLNWPLKLGLMGLTPPMKRRGGTKVVAKSCTHRRVWRP